MSDTSSNTNETTITINELEKQITEEKASRAAEAVQSKHAAEMAHLQKQLDELKAQLTQQSVESADKVAKLQIEAATAAARQPSVKLNTGQDDLRMSQAIKAAGGSAFWHQLTDQQRASALGIADSAQIKDAEIKRYFGRTSSSADAAMLAKSNPGRYRILRALAKNRGIY